MNNIYMKAAIKQAKMAYVKGDVPVGAIIVKNDKIIARAYNKKALTNDPINHAEIIAIKKACKVIKNWRLNGCTMYVTLEPCPMCMGAIEQARIDCVIFGAKREKNNNAEKVITSGSIMEEECSEVLKKFFQNVRN